MSTPRVTLRPLAIADVDEILDYLGTENPRASDAFADALAAHVAKLALVPGMGRHRPCRAPHLTGLRSLPMPRPFRKYLIFYLPTGDGIEVARVLHGARDVDKLLDAS